LEWVRGKFLFGGFGWNGLGVTQHEAVPLLQWAAVTGVAGVSALVCFVNLALFLTVRRFVRNVGRETPVRRLSWEFYVAVILVCGAFLQGLREIRADMARPVARQLRLALVQGNIPQTLKFEPEQKPMILDRYRQLTELVLLTQPELIIWPETATPEPLRYDIDSLALVTNLAAKARANFLTGTIDAPPYVTPVAFFNAAILVRPDGRFEEIYRKIHLVPFGEYVPLRKIVPFLKWVTPITDSFERGREFTVFKLPAARFGTVICFEDTVPDVYRGFVQRGVDFMVNLTNDGWFKTSPAAEMHLVNAVFRAAETRRPLVRCTNNGVTCVVDQYGSVRMRLEPFVAGARLYDLGLRDNVPITLYTRLGDWFVGVCAIVTGVAALVAWRTGGFTLKSPA
jgi:apolipoprotein N-acyltransferase